MRLLLRTRLRYWSGLCRTVRLRLRTGDLGRPLHGSRASCFPLVAAFRLPVGSGATGRTFAIRRFLSAVIAARILLVP